MRRSFFLIAALALAGPAEAAAAPVAVANGTGAPLSNLEMRPVGKGWTSLAPGLSPGARIVANTAGDECAYDIRAGVAGGGSVTWNRLNLCEVKSVTLNRRADGTSWADYD